MAFKVAILLFVCLVSPSSSDRMTPRRALASLGLLTPDFYTKSCPKVFDIVNQVVEVAIAKEKRMGASLLRLHFHDCFVNGCDGSILLDDTPTFTGEKTARPNNNSVRGFDVVDAIKSAVEKSCPNVVSCADILAITARSSVVQLGGKSWGVKLGRRDSTTASFNDANNGAIPAPTLNLTALINVFNQHGLSSNDLVVLSGAHTIGQARCTTFRPRIYNETNIDPEFAKKAKASCPSVSGNGDNNLEPLDVQTPTCFDQKYFVNLVGNKGLLHSDQQLYNGVGGSTSPLVKSYSNNPGTFLADFGAAMIKMGDIKPLTGKQGEVRKNCRKPN